MTRTFSIEFIWWHEKNDQLINEIVNSSGTVVLFLLWEAVNVSKWEHRLHSLVQQIKDKDPTRDTILIVNSWYRPHLTTEKIKNIDTVVYLDFLLLLVYHKLIIQKESTVVSNWDLENNKFLFLTGKSNKVHRIGLLYKFFTQGMLSNAVWSLFYHADSLNDAKQFVPELSDSECKKFFMDHICNPDMVDVIESNGSTHYIGIPYGDSLYKNCDFQVISETEFGNAAWITEKTWLSIINHRPFIMAGGTGILDKLTHMGFRTFNQYLKIPAYDQLDNPEERMSAIVTNTKHWLENIHQYRDMISQDVAHNFKKLLELAVQNLENIQHIINKYELNSTPETLLPLYDLHVHKQWKNWYSRVRDPSWPDCNDERDFANLPAWIQQECIEVFGYKPNEIA